MRSLSLRFASAVAFLAFTSAGMPEANNGPQLWPGLWGPTRNGNAGADARTPKRFRELWRHKSAGGYSEVVSDGSRAFTLEMKDGQDFAVAFDARTGKELWRTRIADTYRGHDGSHDGPISTPMVMNGDVVAYGPNGHLVVMDAATGKEKWRQDLAKSQGITSPAYGVGSSPLVEGNLVIVYGGGEKTGGLFAFDRTTGKQVWHAAHSKTPAYSSAVSATLGGVRQIVAAAGDRVFGVSPADGRLLWSVAGSSPGEEVSNSPLVLPDDRVLLSFWGEAVMLKVAREGETLTAKELWRSPRIRNVHGPTIYRSGYLYGFGGPILVCVDAATGDVKWRQRTYEGSLVGLGDHLLLLGRGSGELLVVRASPDGYAEVTKHPVFNPGSTSITGPSVAGARVFLRNVEEIVALQIEG